MVLVGHNIDLTTLNNSLCPVDNILTRMGAYDNMFSNASTFKVELDER
jgi:DNA mismatch repair ATPase MutS